MVIGGHQCLILVGGSGWFVEVGAYYGKFERTSPKYVIFKKLSILGG